MTPISYSMDARYNFANCICSKLKIVKRNEDESQKRYTRRKSIKFPEIFNSKYTGQKQNWCS